MKKLIKTFLRTWFAIKSIEFRSIFSRLDKNSDNIVILYPNFPKGILRYFYADALVNDVALVNATAQNVGSLRIKIGTRNLNKLIEKNIFLNVSNRYNSHGFRNYANSLKYFILQLEDQANRVFPNSYEVEWWENKVFMHREFDKIGIKTPETTIIDLDNLDINLLPYAYPFLIKEIHSAGSNGVHKVNTIEDVKNIIYNDKIRKSNRYLLLQKLLNMDRDLRVIVVGDKIVLHYWRINATKEWQPTSTKHGSTVDFDFFPEEWRAHIIAEFQKLKITTGAFDLVWENNDYSQTPFVLEISPSYQPNPVPLKNLKTSYGAYKSGFSFFDSWDARFVVVVQRIKNELVAAWLKKP